MNNNPMGYNQGMDSNVFGMNVLRNDGTSQVEANPTLNLLNQSTNQFGGPSTGNPTLDLLNQGNGTMPSLNNEQFHNSGNPTLDLLNESQVQVAQENSYNFVSPNESVETNQSSNGGAFSFLSENENQAMIKAEVNGMAVDNNFAQPVQQSMNQPQPEMMQQMPMMGIPTQEVVPVMNNQMVQPQPMPVEPQPVVQSVQQPQPNAYGFVPMMNQQPSSESTPVNQQPTSVEAPNPNPAPVNVSMGIVDELNFSFIPLREEAPAPVQQPVQQPMNQPSATQVFGQQQVMQPTMMQQPQPVQMQPQGMMGNMQPQMGNFQPMVQTGVVQQSLDALFPGNPPVGNGNFPQ